MCWRQVSKLQKTVLLVLFYFLVYLLISYATSPTTVLKFVSDELRVGDKYVVMFVAAPAAPVLTDAEGAEVFRSRECGRCFVTNNPGFLPMSEYDAVLMVGERSMLAEAAFMEPAKRYLLEASEACVRSKFRRCEPRITSFSGRHSYSLCSLCRSLHKTLH